MQQLTFQRYGQQFGFEHRSRHEPGSRGQHQPFSSRWCGSSELSRSPSFSGSSPSTAESSSRGWNDGRSYGRTVGTHKFRKYQSSCSSHESFRTIASTSTCTAVGDKIRLRAHSSVTSIPEGVIFGTSC